MPEFLPGAFMILAGVGMIVLRGSLALMQASAIGLVIGMANAKNLIPALKIVIILGSVIFIAVGIYSVINTL